MEAASILLQFVTVWAAEWAMVFSMSIPYMDIQVSSVHKHTITLYASKFQFCCMSSIICGRKSKKSVVCEQCSLFQVQIKHMQWKKDKDFRIKNDGVCYNVQVIKLQPFIIRINSNKFSQAFILFSRIKNQR